MKTNVLLHKGLPHKLITTVYFLNDATMLCNDNYKTCVKHLSDCTIINLKASKIPHTPYIACFPRAITTLFFREALQKPDWSNTVQLMPRQKSDLSLHYVTSVERSASCLQYNVLKRCKETQGFVSICEPAFIHMYCR